MTRQKTFSVVRVIETEETTTERELLVSSSEQTIYHDVEEVTTAIIEYEPETATFFDQGKSIFQTVIYLSVIGGLVLIIFFMPIVFLCIYRRRDNQTTNIPLPPTTVELQTTASNAHTDLGWETIDLSPLPPPPIEIRSVTNFNASNYYFERETTV